MKFLFLIFLGVIACRPAAYAQASRRNKHAVHSPAPRRDSLKYFPKLLGDSMSIHFDPGKYLPPNTQATATPVKDTIPAAITQRTNNLVTTYQVSSPHIVVQLFDEGQI